MRLKLVIGRLKFYASHPDGNNPFSCAIQPSTACQPCISIEAIFCSCILKMSLITYSLRSKLYGCFDFFNIDFVMYLDIHYI
jgi:hypothetical protein